MSTTPDPNAPFVAGDPVMTTFAPTPASVSKPPGPFLEFWRSFSANKGALGGLIVIVVIALVAQWARQDRRAGAREDRHSDRGYDDELDAYNAMLHELSRTRR